MKKTFAIIVFLFVCMTHTAGLGFAMFGLDTLRLCGSARETPQITDSAAPIGLAEGLNLYQYGEGNPLAYIDLLGLDPQNTGGGNSFYNSIGYGLGMTRAIVGGFMEDLSNGLEIGLNSLSLGLTDYLGITQSYLNEGFMYDVSRVLADTGTLAFGVAGGLWVVGGVSTIGLGTATVGGGTQVIPRTIQNVNPIAGLERVGSALKPDAYHAFPNVVDNFASSAISTQLHSGATLHQVVGSLNGVVGRFEWIVHNNVVTHRLFVPGGTLNGIPTKP